MTCIILTVADNVSGWDRGVHAVQTPQLIVCGPSHMQLRVRGPTSPEAKEEKLRSILADL